MGIPEGQEIFDRESMLERMGGDGELLGEVLELFLAERGGMMDSLRQAVEGGVAEDVERSAHSLKGALLNIACEPLASLALQIETMGREDRLDDTAAVLSDLESSMDRLETVLRSQVTQRES